MRTIYLFSIFLIFVFLTGCGSQPYKEERSAFIVLKSKAMRYADQGFIYTNADEVKVEIYSSGKAIYALRITRDAVCSGTFSCMDKKRFTKEMLSADYPADTLERIFRGEPVFHGRGVVKKRNGFTQKLANGYKYDIDYSVLNNETVFRDTINHIVIKIKRLRG